MWALLLAVAAGTPAAELTVRSPAWTLAVDGKTGAAVSLHDRKGYQYLTGQPIPLFRYKMEASQRTLLRHAGAILWGPGFEFFSQGELEPLETPPNLPVWWVKERNGDEEFLQPEPAVRASAFSLKDGRRAFFFVNTAPQAVEFDCPEPIRRNRLPAYLYHNGKRREEMRGPWPTSLSLAPYDVVAVVLGKPEGQKN